LQQSQNFVVKASNFKRDIIAEKKRSSIGKFPNSNTQNGSRSTIPIQHISQFQPIQIQHIQSNQPNQSNQSARERLFGQQHLQQNLAAAQAAADLAEQMNNNRKVALVKPELRETCENDMINRFTQQNQMEYFDTDYCEEIVKNQSKIKCQQPEVFSIPRGNLDLEPEVALTEDERRAKEKRMIEIKKMVALQSLQQFSDDQASNHVQMTNAPNYNNYMSSNYHQQQYHDQIDFQKEKKARERLLDLNHELAEQIKEKTRQHAFSGSNGASSSMSPSSIEYDNRITETSFKPSSNASSPSTPYSLNLDHQHGSFSLEQTKEAIKLNNKFSNNNNTSTEQILNSTPGAPPVIFSSSVYLKSMCNFTNTNIGAIQVSSNVN
jgi:hypothetical protein